MLSTIFLNLIKMLVAPLVLATIVSGIAHMGDSSAVGRIGFRAITVVHHRQPDFDQPRPGAGQPVPAGRRGRHRRRPRQAIGEVKKLDFYEFIEHVFPKNVVDAMADNNVLQILVFSLFAGVGLTALGERGAPLVRGRRGAGRTDAADHRLRDALRPVRGVRRARQRGGQERAGHPRHLRACCSASSTSPADAVDDPAVRRLGGSARARVQPGALYPRAGADRVLDRIERSGACPSCSSSSTGSASRAASRASCSRWATASISTAR